MYSRVCILLYAGALFLSLYAQGDDVQYTQGEDVQDAQGDDVQYAQGDDVQVVRSILEANNKTEWSIDKVATIREGRVVALNLNNKAFGKPGLSTLPSEIGQLSELASLTINDNDLAVIPKELFNCTKLTRLEIQNNAIMDLPAGISNLATLQVLDLRNNQLAELPAEIGKLKNLRILQLWGNNFAKLPSEIGNLASLQELYLKGNRLTDLPVRITKLKIKYLDILDNKICNPKPVIHKWLKKFDDKYERLQKCVGEKRFH